MWMELLLRFANPVPPKLRVFAEHYQVGCRIDIDADTRPTSVMSKLLTGAGRSALKAPRKLKHFDILNVCADEETHIRIVSLLVVDEAFCRQNGKGHKFFATAQHPNHILMPLSEPVSLLL